MTEISIFSLLTANPDYDSGPFETEVFNVISFNENGKDFFAKAYFNAPNNINIGYGYDLPEQLSYYQTDLTNIATNIALYPGTYIDTGVLGNNSDNSIIEAASTTPADLTILDTQFTLTKGIDGSAWALAQLPLNRLVSNEADGINPLGGTAEYDSNNLAIPASYELAAIEDMLYDGGSKLVSAGSKLVGDLKVASRTANSGDWLNTWTARTSAWYEIVFHSDKNFGYGPEVRQLRDGEVFGLYSQGTRWTSIESIGGQDPRSQIGNYEVNGNIPSLSDNGEEAVTTLRFLQDNFTSMTGFLSNIPQLGDTSSIIANYESPAVTAINEILSSYASSIEAVPIIISAEVDKIVDTQSNSGVVQAPNGGSGYLLIGGQYKEESNNAVTQGFTYDSNSQITTTLQSGVSGGDILFGFSGTNIFNAQGNDNVIIGDLAIR